MSEPFLAEVKMFGFNFPPRGWAQCDGQILPINQNQSLYSLLGTTYGGDGRTSFGLPDLRGRAPLHPDTGHPYGQKSGQEEVALTVSQMPAHSHAFHAFSQNADTEEPTGARLARAESNLYAAGGTLTTMKTVTQNTGASAGHPNMQPYLVVNFCIAIQGLFPSRN